MQFLFVRYSFISLNVLSALSGEALSLSQGFALVIVYTFSVIMGEQATYNSTLTILGVAVAIILYGLISKHESTTGQIQKASVSKTFEKNKRKKNEKEKKGEKTSKE